MAHDERLWVPWWWWPSAAGVLTLLGAEIHVGYPLAVKVVTYVGLGAPTATLLLYVGAARVAVGGGELLAGRARLPLELAGSVDVVDAETVRRLLGAEADPASYRVTRPWIGGAVRIVVDDPADRTPYWLLSSRHPAALAAAITSGARAA